MDVALAPTQQQETKRLGLNATLLLITSLSPSACSEYTTPLHIHMQKSASSPHAITCDDSQALPAQEVLSYSTITITASTEQHVCLYAQMFCSVRSQTWTTWSHLRNCHADLDLAHLQNQPQP